MPNREDAKTELENILLVTLTPIGLYALRAANGALDGALGFELMRTTQQWTAASYTLSNTATTQTIGAAILSPAYVGIAFYAASTWADGEGVYYSPLWMLPLLNTITGVLDGLVGSAVAGSLPVNPNLPSTINYRYAAAVGVSGGAMSSLVIIATLLLLRIGYLCSIAYPITCPQLSCPKTNMLTQFSSKSTTPVPVQAEPVQVLEAVEVNQPTLSLA